MSRLTLDPRKLIRETHLFEEQLQDLQHQKGLYRQSAFRDGRLRVATRSHQLLAARSNKAGVEHTEPNTVVLNYAAGSRAWRVTARPSALAADGMNIFSRLPGPDSSSFEKAVRVVVDQGSNKDIAEWNKLLAYTDFDSLPTYVSLLALAATEEKQDDFPTRRVFVERCRGTLRSKGISEKLLAPTAERTGESQRREELLRTARMVACLEEQRATPGYLAAAIQFEKVKDIRSALACIYRNVRYRVRDQQLRELDEDVRGLNVVGAGVDVLLAVLTATAPVRSRLPSRKSLFRDIRRFLKARGERPSELLAGLK